MARRAPEELSSSLPWEPVRRAKSRAPPQTFRISNGLRGPSRLRLNRPVIWTRVTIPEPPRPHVRPWLPVSTGWGAPAPPGSAPHRPNQNPWGENRYRLHFKFPRGLRRSTESAGPCARAPLVQGNCHLGPIQNTRFLTRPGDLSAQAPSRGWRRGRRGAPHPRALRCLPPAVPAGPSARSSPLRLAVARCARTSRVTLVLVSVCVFRRPPSPPTTGGHGVPFLAHLLPP